MCFYPSRPSSALFLGGWKSCTRLSKDSYQKWLCCRLPPTLPEHCLFFIREVDYLKYGLWMAAYKLANFFSLFQMDPCLETKVIFELCGGPKGQLSSAAFPRLCLHTYTDYARGWGVLPCLVGSLDMDYFLSESSGGRCISCIGGSKVFWTIFFFCLIDLKTSQHRHMISTTWKRIYLKGSLNISPYTQLQYCRPHSFQNCDTPEGAQPVGLTIKTSIRKRAIKSARETHLCTLMSYINQLCLFILSYRTLVNA